MFTEATHVDGAEEVLRAFLAFLNSYSSDVSENSIDTGSSIYLDYIQQLKVLRECDGTTLYVNFQHLVRCVKGHSSAADRFNPLTYLYSSL